MKNGVLRRGRLWVAMVIIVGVTWSGSASQSQGLASEPGIPSGELRITSPVEAAIVNDGNLVLIEGEVVDEVDGVVDRLEIAFDDADDWQTVTVVPGQTRWSYLWSDPVPGPHRIRARAFGVTGRDIVEQSVSVQVRDSWDTSYVIANPYATRGAFRKGQLHVHSTNSFDGWESLPPAELAREYKRRGYAFIAITDHDVISRPREVEDATFLTIPAYESTSGSGHITALWVDTVVDLTLPAQARLDAIAAAGGLAILNHPSYLVGWTGVDLGSMHGFFAVEVYNGITSDPLRADRNVGIWREGLNAKGWPNRTWVVAVDDAHSVAAVDRGWVMVKCAELTEASLRRALIRGASYASNGPSFQDLGVLDGAILASSPDAAFIRFIDQDGHLLRQGRASGSSYTPTGRERWIRVEAVTREGNTAWSQPFWLLPNAPKAELNGETIRGETLPWARVHVSDHGQYLGNVLADEAGSFVFTSHALAAGKNSLWILATGHWPDAIESTPTLLETG